MLLESKDYYQSIVYSLEDAFCIIEKALGEPLDFHFTEVNPAFVTHAGVNDVVGKTIRQVFPDDHLGWLETCDQILKTGEPQRFECEYIARRRVFEVYAFRIDKAHRRIAIYSKDITQRKITENSLMESEKKYRALIENYVGMIFLHDLEGKLLEINTAAVTHSGYSKAELLKQSIFDLHPDQSQRDDIIDQWKSWPVGNRVTLVTNQRHKNGTIFPVEVTAGKILIQRGERILAFVRDITDRLATEERLVRQDRILEGIGHFREALVCDSEEDAGAIYLQVAKELTDSKMGIMGEVYRKGLKDIVISRPAWDACHIKIPKGHYTEPQEMEIQGLYGTIIREGKGFYTNDPPSHPDSIGTPEGHPPLTSFLGVPLLGKGEVLGMIAVANREGGYRNEDLEALTLLSETIVQIFMRHRAEKAWEELNMELELANRRKGEFLSILSHEIRNPLAAITLGLSLLKRTAAYEEKGKQTLEIMSRQVTHLSRLVDDLLDVTRIARNKIELRKELVELNELVAGIIEEYQPMFQGKGVALTIEFAPMNLYLQADPVRLSQAVGNLLHNAMKFTQSGGFTQVTLHSDKAPKLAEIHIQDNGCGIAPEVLEGLFEPFVQGNIPLDRENVGLGLGLSLAKGLVELHGGTVVFFSEGLGKGSKFTLHLPLVKEHLPEPDNENSPHRHHRQRVLLIEDMKDVADILKLLLEAEGHDVKVANDGTAGIAMAKDYRPDVILCDIGLPGMDGYQVAKTLRSDKELQNTLLISLTGYARPEDVKRSQEAGFHYQLAKPVDLDKLRQTLAQAKVSPDNQIA